MRRVQRGATWPPLILALKAEAPALFPPATGATFILRFRRLGTVAPDRVGTGTVDLAVSADGSVLTAAYRLSDADTAIPGRYQLFGEVVFASGHVVRIPAFGKWNADGAERLTVVDCGDSVQSDAVPSELFGYIGPWVGQWVS